MSPVLLDNVVQHYAWGSRTVIPSLIGAPSPADEPWAELWMGAHAGGPSRLPDGRTLRDVEPSLPYLLKVLAADAPLSLQAHPSRSQAQAGYAAEEAAGVPLDAPTRRYRDANHKPELMCALTPVDALCGFRRPDATRRLVEGLGVSELSQLTEPLLAGDESEGLRHAFTALMTLPPDRSGKLVDEVDAAARRVLGRPDIPASWRAPLQWMLALAKAYPGDVGVVTSLMLHILSLSPGEAVYLPAGNLHAYLAGAGVEIMASSDNVLRGGLTPKHVDVPELLSVLKFSAEPPPVVLPSPESAGVWVYRTPTPDFALRRVDVEHGVVVVQDAVGPRIVLCVSGSLYAGATALPRGASAYLSSEEALELRGRGTAYVASPGSA